MLRYQFILLGLIFHSYFSQGQEPANAKEKFLRIDSLEVRSGESYDLKSTAKFTAIVFAFNDSSIIKGSFIETFNDRIELSQDIHFDSDDNILHSNVISFQSPLNSLKFNSQGFNGILKVYFINSGISEEVKEGKLNSPRLKGCEEPPSIDQEVWRAGLPEPSYNRIYGETRHVIIHHSAGSNFNTNYTQVVRDIYIYHTQVNGWSDIGYNYLIAGNGQIYKGRDPLEGDQDLVQGAHFCGKNSNTSGICLMGNFTAISPSSNTLTSLTDLLSWKIYKDELDPLGNMTSNGIQNLDIIAGHRDGCSTECPGEMTYAKLDSLRLRVEEIVNNCNGQPSQISASFYGFPIDIIEGDFVSFVNTSEGRINNFDWYFEGGSPLNSNASKPGQVRYNQEGLYDVILIISNEGSNSSDTSIIKDYIRVRQSFDPIISPNPLYRPYIAEIKNVNLEVSLRIKLFDQTGRLISDFISTQNNNELDFGSISPGIYILTLEGFNQSKTLRLVII